MVKEKSEYLFSLKVKEGQFLKSSGRRTFIYGLVITARSILSISKHLLFSTNPLYKYILTYKFSQDHIELLFAKIRCCSGNNNNPNALQLQHIIRKLLLRNNIKLTDNYNCLELDNDPVGSVFNFIWKKKRKETILYEESDIESNSDEINERNINIERPYNENLQHNMLYYISGYIVKKLSNINCYYCVKSLTKDDVEHNYARNDSFAKFFDYSNNDPLIRASTSVYRIVTETEKHIKLLTLNFLHLNVKNLDAKVILKVKNVLALDNSIFPNLNCENVDILHVPHKIT